MRGHWRLEMQRRNVWIESNGDTLQMLQRWYDLEMCRSIGIGKYRLKSLVSVSVEFLVLVAVFFNLYQIATENKIIEFSDS